MTLGDDDPFVTIKEQTNINYYLKCLKFSHLLLIQLQLQKKNTKT